MKRLIFVFLIMLILNGLCEAGTITYSWTAPTTDTQGNTLVSDGLTITSYSLYCGTAAGAESATPIYTGTALTYTITGVTDGTSEYCYATATASNGKVSPQSLEVKKTFSAVPSAPTLQ